MPALLAHLLPGPASAVMLAVAHQPLPPPHHRPRLVRVVRIPPDLLHQLGRAGTRPRHLGLRRVALGGWLILVTLLGSAASLNAYVGYAPTLPLLFGALPSHPAGSRFSRVETLPVGDRALGVDRKSTRLNS